MRTHEENRIRELIELPLAMTLPEFDEYITLYLRDKSNKKTALFQLDNEIARLQNYVLLLSLHVKQNYLVERKSEAAQIIDPETNYTKEEVAAMYRVDVRTVSNWIQDGLESTELRGIVRITRAAILAYAAKSKTKKFHWKIAR